MGTLDDNSSIKCGNDWFSQKELAERWKVSQSTITNWRNQNKIPFFSLPGTSKKLYPIGGIIELERQNTNTIKGVHKKYKQPAELKRKKPGVSVNPKKDWRI